MEFGLYLVPVLSGYWFLTHLHYTNYIELSPKSRKSYIGLILGSEITRHGEPDIALIPLVSGYRDKDTLELEFTTNYAPAIKKSLEDVSGLQHEDFQIVISRNEVVSARIFHPDVPGIFQDEKGNAP